VCLQIEEAHITELDWALANVGGNGKTGLEAEAKKLGVDVSFWMLFLSMASHRCCRATFRHWAHCCSKRVCFLLPNRMPILRRSIDNDPKATDKINSVLRKNGIKYTHHNDKVLVETPAERARTKQAVKVHSLRIAYLTSWSHLMCRRGNRCPKSPQSQAQPRRLRNGHLDGSITK
jgi:hypothetical protein